MAPSQSETSKRKRFGGFLKVPFRSQDRSKSPVDASRSSSVSSPPPSSSSQPQHASAPKSREEKESAPNDALWIETFNKLSSDDQKLLLRHVPLEQTSTSTLPMAILESVQEKRRLCETEGWTLVFGNKSIYLKDIANEALSWLEKFKGAVDVAVSADPLHAGLPWAGIRIILEAAGSDRKQMEALVRGLNRIFYLIYRCQIYEFLMNESSGLTKQNLRSALLDFYSAIWKFMAQAIHIDGKGTTRRVIDSFWTSSTIEEFERQCIDLEQRAETEAQNCERVQSLKTRQLLENMPKMKDLKDSIEHIEAIVSAMWKTMQQGEIGSVLWRVSEIPYEDHHKTARRNRTKGTGDWIFHHPQYQKWEKWSSGILWLHGIPGAGKTKLVSRIIDHIQQSEITLAYFYCSRSDESRRKPTKILQSYIKQLSSPKDGSIQQALVDVYQANERKGSPSLEFDLNECEQLLSELLKPFSQVMLVLDALDETYDDRERTDLLRLLDHLAIKSGKLKVLISSRRDESIVKRLEQGLDLGIEADDNGDDIIAFVHEQLDRINQDRRQPFSDSLRDEIVRVLSEKHEGMFQWAALQIEQIERLPFENDIRKRLGQLPKDLEAAYEELLQQINKSDGSRPIIAKRAFQWIIFSSEPLRPEELVELVSRDMETGSPTHEEVKINNILDACRNLVVSTDEGNWTICQFAHLSVREHLEGDFSNMKHSIYTGLATVTIAHLLDRINIRVEEHSQYALFRIVDHHAASWWEHYAKKGLESENSHHLQNLINNLFNPKNFERFSEFSSKIYEFFHLRSLGFLNPFYGSYYLREPLPCATKLGFDFAVDTILKENLDVIHEHVFQDAILVAAEYGHTKLLVRLLQVAESHGVRNLPGIIEEICVDSIKELEVVLKMLCIQDNGNGPENTTKAVGKLKIGEVFEAAAENTHSGFMIWQYLFDLYPGNLPVSEALVESAVSNWKGGAEILQRVLEEYKEAIPITESMLLAAAENEHIPDEFLKLFATLSDGELHVTSEIIEKVVANTASGHKVIQLLSKLDNCSFDMTDETYKAVVKNRETGGQILALLFNKYGTRVSIPEDILETAAAQNFEVMRVFLGQQGDQFPISESLMKSAATSNHYRAREIMKLLLGHSGSAFTIPEEIFKAVAGNRHNQPELMKCLLDHAGNDFTLPEEIFKAVAENMHSSPWTMKNLLDHAGSDFTIPEEVFKIVAENVNGPAKMIKHLFEHAKNDVTIPEEIFGAVVENRDGPPEMMKHLLDHAGGDFTIPEEIFTIVAENEGDEAEELMEVLWGNAGSDSLPISEDILTHVARKTGSWAAEMMDYLLEQAGSRLTILEDLLKIVAKNAGNTGYRIAMSLLGQTGSDFTISEDLLKIVAGGTGKWADTMMSDLLEKAGREFTISDDLVRIVAGNTGDWGHRMMEYLLEKAGSEFTISDDLMKVAERNEGPRSDEIVELLVAQQRAGIASSIKS